MFRAAVALAACLAIGACGSSSGDGDDAGTTGGEQQGEQTLRVTVYGGAWVPGLEQGAFKAFQEKTGARVNVVLGSDEEWLARLRASNGKNPPFDLVTFLPHEVEVAASAGLLEPIDVDRIPHARDINPALYDAAGLVDGDDVYGLPFDYARQGLGYRTDKVEEAPRSWLDLGREDVKGKVALSPLTAPFGQSVMQGLVGAKGGTLPDDAQVGFDELEKLKGSAAVFPPNSTAISDALARGDAWIAAHTDARIQELADSGAPVAWAAPESTPIGMSVWSIPKGAQHEDLVYELLDALTEPEAQKVFGKATYNSMANVKSGMDTAGDDPEFIEFGIFSEHMDEWQEEWNKIFG